jgi:cytochrome c peroxidase
LKKVGTFDGTQKNETRIVGITSVAPLGADGFVPPTLMGLHAFPQTYFHNGSANSLDEVMNVVAHRASGTSGVDTLTDPNQRAQIIKYILSIDAFSTPIPPQ